MKLVWNNKDGGEHSRVWMYGLESKRFGSALLLRFENGSREAYHSHAFNAKSWLIAGKLIEHIKLTWYGRTDYITNIYYPSLEPIATGMETMHKVTSKGRSWVVSFRGPWRDVWHEIVDEDLVELTHGRKQK